MQNNEMTAVVGGEEITVTKLDGAEEKVFVREQVGVLYPIFLLSLLSRHFA